MLSHRYLIFTSLYAFKNTKLSKVLFSHTLPASELPTGRHLLLGNTQEVKSAGREILHISEAFPVYEEVLLVSAFNSLLDLVYNLASTDDSNTFLNHCSFKYLLISKYYLNY